MKKLFKRVLSLAIVASVGIPQINADTNDYSIEIKSYNYSKHSRSTNPLYGITYTEEDATYTDRNWPLVEISHAYTQSNYSQTLAKPQIVRQFGVSMGVVYWINPVENYIYWWNTVTGESGRTTPTKSYGVGYQDGINNSNFDFTFKGAETGSGAISQDWYGNLVHMWNEGLNGWGTTAGTHFVQGYAVYKSATEYGQLMDFTPKLSKMDDTGRESYPYYRRKINASDGKLTGSSSEDLSNYDYISASSMVPNPNYPANTVDWSTNYDYHKANTSIAKQPTDFLGVSGNLWGKGILQDANAPVAPSAYYNGYSTGQVFHARGNIAFGNMFADGQYTNWYLNYKLYAQNPANAGSYPVSGQWTTENTSVYSEDYIPGSEATTNNMTEYLFRETDVLEYFWNTPGAGTTEFDISDRSSYVWRGTVYDLNSSKYLGTTATNRVKTDMMSAPEIDSIKGSRIYVHNYWLDNTALHSTNRNGSIAIQYSKYDGGLSTTSAPVFTGNQSQSYTAIGYSFGYNKTKNDPYKFTNTSVSCWNELERVNNNVMALYSHVPGLGFSKVFITAVKPNNAVSNLQISQSWNANGDPVHTLTWTPQTYDRSTMHTYEVWYRKKKVGASSYEEKKTIGGTSRDVWVFAGKASVKYKGATDSTKVVTSGAKTYTIPNASFYNQYEGCTFEHIAPRGDNGDGTKYDRTYEYLVIPVYDASSHRGTESAIVSKNAVAAPSKIYGNLYQVTEKNENDETLYGFSIRLDLNFTPGAMGSAEAKRLIITSAGGYEGSDKLKDAMSVTLEDGTPLTPQEGITFVSNSNGNTTTHGAYALDIDITGKVGADGKLPSIIWHNVNPEWEFKMAAHIESSSTIQYTGTGELSTTLYVPEPYFSLTPADFHKLDGDYGSLTGDEDLPIGTFRRIDPTTKTLDLTKKEGDVILNNANYYGTNGSALRPIYVTDEVMGTLNSSGEYENSGWRVGYMLKVYDGDEHVYTADFNFQTDPGGWATVYSNINNVICDFVGMNVDYTTEIGEDGRERKVYNPIPKTYKVLVDLEFYRFEGEKEFKECTKVLRTKEFELELGTTTLPTLDVNNISGNAVLGALYQRGESHFFYNGLNDEGYYPFYYDAAMLFNWTNERTLNRYMGYYGASKAKCYGHYENKEHNPNTWVEYHAGSVLPDGEVDLLNQSTNPVLTDYAKIGYNENNRNWSAQAIANDQLPMMIHYVHGSNSSLVTNEASPASNEKAVSDIKFDVTLTAEYPIVVHDPNHFSNVFIAEDPSKYQINSSTREMNVMTVPTSLSDMYVNSAKVTTGVEGIITDAYGGIKLYPNPVVSTFTLEAPMTINVVKIFTSDGQLVKVVKGINDTKASINVEDLPRGVYIVNTLGIAKMMIKM